MFPTYDFQIINKILLLKYTFLKKKLINNTIIYYLNLKKKFDFLDKIFMNIFIYLFILFFCNFGKLKRIVITPQTCKHRVVLISSRCGNVDVTVHLFLYIHFSWFFRRI